MNSTSSKDKLLEIISSLKKDKSYFNYDEINVLLKEKNVQLTNSTLKTYLHYFTKNKIIFNAGRGWYSSIEKPFMLNTKPVNNIIKTINEKNPLLTFSVWSTEQLNPYTHHILSKFVTFIYVDFDFIKIITYFLRNTGYNVYENPNKTEIEKQFSLIGKTVIVRPSLTKQPAKNGNASPIEKIFIDFLIENNKLKIMDNYEAESVVNNAINYGRINISALLSYSKRRKFDPPKIINQIQHNI